MALRDFTYADACVVHRAMLEAIVESVERKERMPSSSAAIAKHALELKALRNKILDGLTDKERLAFPDYRPAAAVERDPK